MKTIKTKNTLADLNNILFEELERLNDESLRGEELKEEINRGRALSGVATQVILNARTVLEATKLADDHMDPDLSIPRLLTEGAD